MPNFTVDIEMKVSTLAETITVSGESPMIETSQPASTLTIDGQLLRSAPVTSRRLFSDVLDMAPGISSRNVNDGVGRRSYNFKGTGASMRSNSKVLRIILNAPSRPRRCIIGSSAAAIHYTDLGVHHGDDRRQQRRERTGPA